MIITCTACRKKYLIEGSVLTEKGRQVRCGECGNVWWQKQENTDPIPLDPKKEGIIEKDRIPSNMSPGLHKLGKAIEDEDRPRGLKAFINNYYLDWLVIIFALGVVLFVTYRERGTIFDQAPSFKKVINPRISGNPGALTSGLIVQGINYDTANHNNMPHLIITGELVNTSSQTASVPPLTITISGKNNGQTMQPKSHTWQHANQNEQILPGGHLPFQTMTTHPGWSTIEKIDVSY